eukprot:GHVH01003761.1.p1 GENE.GHVH01003761.1~~GHVH01003761.1.p1  ORF type:complete len:478 (-),score=70.11 GHVH01003761.1:70-1503(-)
MTVSNPYHDIAHKHVLLVAVGQDTTKEPLYRDLHDMGATLIVLENEDNVLATKLFKKGIFQQFIRLDLTSRGTLVEECIDAIDDCGIRIDGVLTFWDDAVGLSVRIASHYDLPSNTVESIDTAHDKQRARLCLQSAGFTGPRFCTVHSRAELLEKSQTMRFPIILKPLYGAASIGVIKVNNMSEISTKYDVVVAILESELSTGGLMGLTFESPWTGQNDVMTFCMEEFLDGPEYDVDVIMSEGEVVYAKAVDNLPLQPPNFCEIMELTPISRGQKTAELIQDYSGRVLKALGFKCGLFHVEIIDDRCHGPVLVECNPRMGGGPMRMIHRDVFGVDLAEEALRIAIGIQPQLSNIKQPANKKCVTINLHAICSGKLKEDSISALDFLKGPDSNATFWISPNQRDEVLTGWGDGYPSKMGRIHLMYDNIDSDEAIERANEVLNQFNHNLANLTELENRDDRPPIDFFTARKKEFSEVTD